MSKPREAYESGRPSQLSDAGTETMEFGLTDPTFERGGSTPAVPYIKGSYRASPERTSIDRRLTVIIAELGLALMILATIAVLLFVLIWRNNSSIGASSTNHVAPPSTGAVDAREDPNLIFERELAISFSIRKSDHGALLAPYKAARGETFSLGDKFSIILEPNADGSLFVFNEGDEVSGGNSINLLFPTPSVNGGSANIAGGKSIETSLNTVTGQPGKEILWIVWSSKSNTELEDVCRLAYDTGGVVRDEAKRAWLKSFLLSNVSSGAVRSETAPDQRTLIKGTGENIVYMSELWPPLGHSQ